MSAKPSSSPQATASWQLSPSSRAKGKRGHTGFVLHPTLISVFWNVHVYGASNTARQQASGSGPDPHSSASLGPSAPLLGNCGPVLSPRLLQGLTSLCTYQSASVPKTAVRPPAPHERKLKSSQRPASSLDNALLPQTFGSQFSTAHTVFILRENSLFRSRRLAPPT